VVYTLLLFAAVPAIIHFFNRATLTNIYSLLKSKALPPVTILTSMHNEAKNIKENVLSALNSNYDNLYVLLINDGSTDSTLDLVIDTFSMRKEPLIFDKKIKTAGVNGVYVSSTHPNLMLIDKQHSGVGDSLNVGLNACFTPYFMTLDADSTIHENAVSELIFELLSNEHSIGVGGAVYIRNACTYHEGKMLESKIPYRLVPALQSNEYLRSHLFNRTGWNKLGSTMSYSGTATLLSTYRVIEVGGFDTDNYSQDTEIVMRLSQHMRKKKQAYQISFNPAAIVWTDVPNTLKQFTIQRDRWQRGILKSALMHKEMFFNPNYKIQGLVSYPCYVLFELIAPFIEFTAYITVSIAYFWGILNATSTIIYMLLAWGFTTYLTIANMLINIITFDQYKKPLNILWMFCLTIIEMFGFRQYQTIQKVFSSVHYFINRLRGKAL
jgi:cellulose synthase/poly-beta-1,6-N-acetylglucosamine synthase-like glycosyltransferase